MVKWSFLTFAKNYYLWLQMARMEMDCDVKKMAFFKFVLCILQKSLKKLIKVCSLLQEIA